MEEINFYLVAYLPRNIEDEILKLANIVSEKFNTHTFVRSWKPHLTV
jgi:hypothetical protein